MVDISKRKTLLSVGGMMALPLLPALTTAAAGPFDEKYSHESKHALEQNKSELNIELLPDGASPAMRVTNLSDEVITLHKIRLGIVQAGGKTYDLNRSLSSGAYTIGAGQSRLIPIIEAGNTPVEPMLSARYGHMPMRTRMATLETSKGNNRRNNTVSAMFA